MIRKCLAATVWVALGWGGHLSAQSSFGTVGGTVTDASGALIPGASVTATNVGTNVSTSAVSNDSGTYNVQALLPGTYKVTVELPGFQTKTVTNVRLGNAEQVRLNFALTVAGVNTGIEVTVAPDTVLTTTSSSVGEVLTQQKISDLPLVGNNVLDLMSVVNGITLTNDPIFNANSTTFAGVAANYLTVQREHQPCYRVDNPVWRDHIQEQHSLIPGTDAT